MGSVRIAGGRLVGLRSGKVGGDVNVEDARDVDKNVLGLADAPGQGAFFCFVS